MHLLIHLGAKRQHVNIPFSVVGVAEAPHFVGREQELENIHNSLAGDGRRRTVVLHGRGGMGKTQTAMAYASRYRESYSAIF
jgi:Cdc6-like AAA superfamily ATPase